jgi:hypothetical protein
MLLETFSQNRLPKFCKYVWLSSEEKEKAKKKKLQDILHAFLGHLPNQLLVYSRSMNMLIKSKPQRYSSAEDIQIRDESSFAGIF